MLTLPTAVEFFPLCKRRRFHKELCTSMYCLANMFVSLSNGTEDIRCTEGAQERYLFSTQRLFDLSSAYNSRAFSCILDRSFRCPEHTLLQSQVHSLRKRSNRLSRATGKNETLRVSSPTNMYPYTSLSSAPVLFSAACCQGIVSRSSMNTATTSFASVFHLELTAVL